MSNSDDDLRPPQPQLGHHDDYHGAQELGCASVSDFKVVLLGEGAVGKSSILLRYVEDKFDAEHKSTLQAAFATKKLRLEDSDTERGEINLHIWDTAGQEKFHALGPIYYRDSQGAILVYDITDPHSFERVQNWVRELEQMLGDSVVMMIAGNKIDLEETRAVARDGAEEYALSHGAQFTECSAKENLGISHMFNHLCREMVKKANMRALAEANSDSSNLRRHGSRRSIRIADDDGEENRRRRGERRRGGKCCS